MSKVLVLGHARHGKGTFVKFLGLSHASSSRVALDAFLFEKLAEHGLNYASKKDAYQDRVNHRSLWYDLICDYNSIDPSRLAKDVLSRAQVYDGMRSVKEYNECMDQELFDFVFWIDASKRKPMESPESMSIEYDPNRMILIDNNLDVDNIEYVARLAGLIISKGG